MKKKSRDYRKFTRSLKRFDKFCDRVINRNKFFIINLDNVLDGFSEWAEECKRQTIFGKGYQKCDSSTDKTPTQTK